MSSILVLKNEIFDLPQGAEKEIKRKEMAA